MRTLELFCGTKSFSKVAKEYGHDTFTIDIDKRFNPDLCIDILDMDINYLKDNVIFKDIDILWASPPCQTFSVASIRHYWKDGKPKNDKCINGIKIVEKTIEIIKILKPKVWFIENPRGMLRKQECMKDLPRQTISYCQYGLDIMKPTDIWTNLAIWSPRKICRPGASCHQRASRSSRNGTQGIVKNKFFNSVRSAELRAVIPPALFKELFECLRD